MKTLLVTGTDTNVGKTWITCLLLRQLRSAGLPVGAYKPVCSGAVRHENGARYWDDVTRLRESAGGVSEVDQVCPQRFQAAVAPHVAAGLEGRTVDDQLLRSGAEAWRGKCDFLIIEGAGGLLCPLSDQSTVADLAAALSTPILIVAANRLGVINHTLLTVEVAQGRGLQIAGVVLNDTTDQSTSDDASRQSNLEQLDRWLPVPVLQCKFHGRQLCPSHSGRAEFTAIDLFTPAGHKGQSFQMTEGTSD